MNIPESERKKHTYVIGKSGCRKSELLKVLIYRDIEAGHGVTLIDPHGDLATFISRFPFFAPGGKRHGDLVYIDPEQYQPLAYNPFEVGQHHKDLSRPERENLIDLTTDQMVAVFTSLMERHFTPNMRTLFDAATRIILEMPGATFLTFQELMSAPKITEPFAQYILTHSNSAVRGFFETDFFSSGLAAARRAIRTTFQEWLSVNRYLKIFSCSENRLDFGAFLATRKVVVLRLSKGGVGEGGSRALGTFFYARLFQEAMKRQAIPETQRHTHFCYIDEFQNYVTHTLQTALAEVRKYGLHFCLANQFIGQDMSPQFVKGLFGNTAVLIAGRLQESDGTRMAKEMNLHIEDLAGNRDLSPFTGLPDGVFYIKAGSSPVYKVKAPTALHVNKDDYQMPAQHWAEILEENLQAYYQVNIPKSKVTEPQKKRTDHTPEVL